MASTLVALASTVVAGERALAASLEPQRLEPGPPPVRPPHRWRFRPDASAEWARHRIPDLDSDAWPRSGARSSRGGGAGIGRSALRPPRRGGAPWSAFP